MTTVPGRPPKFSELEFRNAYARTRSIAQVALRLKCSKVTARRYAQRLGLPTDRRRGSPGDLAQPIKSLEMFRSFTEAQTLDELVEATGINRKRLTDGIARAIQWLWGERLQKNIIPNAPLVRGRFNVPAELTIAPPRLSMVRLVNLVIDDRSYIDRPRFAAERCRLPEEDVVAYLNQCLETYHAKRTTSTPENDDDGTVQPHGDREGKSSLTEEFPPQLPADNLCP